MAFKMKGSELYGKLKLNRNMDNSSQPDGRAKSSAFQKDEEQKTKVEVERNEWGETPEEYNQRMVEMGLRKPDPSDLEKAKEEIRSKMNKKASKRDKEVYKKGGAPMKSDKLKKRLKSTVGTKGQAGAGTKKISKGTGGGKMPGVIGGEEFTFLPPGTKSLKKGAPKLDESGGQGGKKTKYKNTKVYRGEDKTTAETTRSKKNLAQKIFGGKTTKTTTTSRGAEGVKYTRSSEKTREDRKGRTRKKVTVGPKGKKTVTRYRKDGTVKSVKVKKGTHKPHDNKILKRREERVIDTADRKSNNVYTGD